VQLALLSAAGAIFRGPPSLQTILVQQHARNLVVEIDTLGAGTAAAPALSDDRFKALNRRSDVRTGSGAGRHRQA